MTGEPQPTLDTANLKALAGESAAGRLSLDPSVAGECAAACGQLIDKLQDIGRAMHQADRLLALGSFHCGDELAKALREVAASTNGGLIPRLDEHVKAVTLIHDMIGASVSSVVTSDSHQSQAIGSVGSQVGGS